MRRAIPDDVHRRVLRIRTKIDALYGSLDFREYEHLVRDMLLECLNLLGIYIASLDPVEYRDETDGNPNRRVLLNGYRNTFDFFAYNVRCLLQRQDYGYMSSMVELSTSATFLKVFCLKVADQIYDVSNEYLYLRYAGYVVGGVVAETAEVPVDGARTL